ncbi:MAG: apolipoprotein N-acyltransferase [Syntrophales bacterium]
MNRKDIALSALSGILLFLSFPKFGNGIVAWVSLVPLLLALRNLNIREGLAAGFIAGVIYYVGIVYWIVHVIIKYGDLPVYAAFTAMLLLASVLSLYLSLFSAGVVFFRRRGVPEIVSAPLLWICIEFIKSHLFTGFPWENLAYSQYRYLVIIQAADIAGIYGIAFVIVFINTVIYSLIADRGNKKESIAVVVAGLVLLGAVALYGVHRVQEISNVVRNLQKHDVALIQGNIDQSIKWDPAYQDESLRIYKDLSERAIRQPAPELIVWPETATPFFFQDTDERHREILDIARKGRSFLLLGSPSYRAESAVQYYQNSAFMISPEGDIVGKYDKVHLVPFGEYVPLRKVFPFMSRLVMGVGDFLPGEGYKPLAVGKHKAGVLICYEAIFPEISRAYGKAGAELFVNITNDAWFGRTSAPYQHLTMAVFRAVENRRYTLRAANTGISSVIDPTGKILSETALFEKAVLKGKVGFLGSKTVYLEYGDVLVYAGFIILALSAIISRKEKKNV